MATFYIEAIENTTITLSKEGSPTVGAAKYGVNDATVQNMYTYGDSISLTAGQKCYWTIESSPSAFSTTKYLHFTSTGKFNVGGALSDLIGGDTAIPRNYCFSYLFVDCTGLTDAGNLTLLGDLNGKTHCYSNMFNGCTSLTTAPELPATTLTERCYASMFRDCASLTTAPALPATTMVSNCYSNMFDGCTSLTTAPALPATTLALNCYAYMFSLCKALAVLPDLPATTLAQGCYGSMFSGCSGIKLSATQTGEYQVPYRIPESGTGVDVTGSMNFMFTGTGGTFTGTPTINTTYYLANIEPSGWVKITYHGQVIALFESGTKTLKCADNSMLSDVVVEVIE